MVHPITAPLMSLLRIPHSRRSSAPNLALSKIHPVQNLHPASQCILLTHRPPYIGPLHAASNCYLFCRKRSSTGSESALLPRLRCSNVTSRTNNQPFKMFHAASIPSAYTLDLVQLTPARPASSGRAGCCGWQGIWVPGLRTPPLEDSDHEVQK